VVPLFACSQPYRWRLPQGFPEPPVPADNAMSDAKVELGRRLFYDTRLSADAGHSCASCHEQAHAFAETRARSLGLGGEPLRRNAPSLANVAYAEVLTWGNPLLRSLERQMLVPLLAEHPPELGLAGHERELLDRLRADRGYANAFRRAFAHEDAVTLDNVVRAIACFERTLLSGDSAYDRFVTGRDPGAFSSAARRGLALFGSSRLHCTACHGGFAFTDTASTRAHRASLVFHNTGLYDVDGRGAYPPRDRGIQELTLRAEDMGRYRAPGLRNVALTAPYMHDGSVATLEQVIDHYAQGGRAGHNSHFKDPRVTGFAISPQERADLVAFLRALTDDGFVTDPRFARP
jgi:cytochrome c peroxidase